MAYGSTSWNSNLLAKNYKYYSVDESGYLHGSNISQAKADAISSTYKNSTSGSTASTGSVATEGDQWLENATSQLLANNQASAQAQMDFQERMSNTSHQREVQDLIAAGLNPVLSANNGASTPNGSYANVDSSLLNAKATSKLQTKLAEMNNSNAYKIAKLQADNANAMNKYSTDIGAQVSLANANTAAEASKYGSQLGYNASLYSSDNAFKASVYNTDETNTTNRGNIKAGPFSFNTGNFKKLFSNIGKTSAKKYVNSTNSSRK